MRFIYCPICGSKLILKNIGDDGLTPYCDTCRQPRFDMFSTCVITLVINNEGKVALLKQNYISTEYRTLVSGYMIPGETAEEAAKREVMEVDEVGWFTAEEAVKLVHPKSPESASSILTEKYLNEYNTASKNMEQI